MVQSKYADWFLSELRAEAERRRVNYVLMHAWCDREKIARLTRLLEADDNKHLESTMSIPLTAIYPESPATPKGLAIGDILEYRKVRKTGTASAFYLLLYANGHYILANLEDGTHYGSVGATGCPIGCLTASKVCELLDNELSYWSLHGRLTDFTARGSDSACPTSIHL